MANKTLNIPDNMPISIPMTVNDTLSIIVTRDCTWSYSPDPSAVFPNFLPARSYAATTPPTTYGPYTPATRGAVDYNAVASSNSNTATADMLTARSITVS